MVTGLMTRAEKVARVGLLFQILFPTVFSSKTLFQAGPLLCFVWFLWTGSLTQYTWAYEVALWVKLPVPQGW